MLDLFPINKCNFTGKKNHFSSKIEKYFSIQKNQSFLTLPKLFLSLSGKWD